MEEHFTLSHFIQDSRARKIEKNDERRERARRRRCNTRQGTPFELWFFPRRTIVERLVFTFLMFLPLPHVSLACIVHMYLSPRAQQSTWSGYLYKPSQRYELGKISTGYSADTLHRSYGFFNKFKVGIIYANENLKDERDDAQISLF